MAAKGGPLKIGSDRRYAETLEALIADDNYSPEAALHEIENNPEKYGSFETRICRQTLYAYIDKGVFLRLTNKALPFKGSRRKKKTKHVQRAKQQPKGESMKSARRRSTGARSSATGKWIWWFPAGAGISASWC